MKFKGSIDIARPVQVVTDLFANPDNLGAYQEGFERRELISGAVNKDAAVSKLFYKQGKQTMELTETIIVNRLPESFEAVYHHKYMDNTMKCIFSQLDNGGTRYETEVEYTRIDWVMPRLMALLFPGMYKRPARRWLENFKRFVENSHG